MSDTDNAFSPSYLEDAQRRQASASIVSAADDDPEKAARAIELGDATGTNPVLVHGDLDNFEAQQKIAVNAKLVGDNQFLQGYLNSHPMAASVSHDDLGQLDAASQAISNLPDVGESAAQRAVTAFKSGFGEFSAKAILSDPLLSRPQDIDYAARHPVASGIMMGIADLGVGPMTVLSKGFSGLLSVVNEFGGREAASMLEYGLMRGDLEAPGTGTHGDIAQVAKGLADTGTAISAAAPWLRSGRDIPAGVHPELDKLAIDQAKTDGDSIADALSESAKSATRERAPDLYAGFVRGHVGDREIGISADAVRELYGDKPPTVDDGMLGWVPDLTDRLANAEATGGDVKVPLADWLAKVDPEVADQLHDHLRVRPDGLTIDEGKNLEPKEAITEPLQLTRANASLEPLFSIGDRKVKLERVGQAAEGKEQPAWAKDAAFHDFNLQDETGKTIGSLNLSEQKGGKQLYVEMIQAGADKRMYDPNFLGPALIRDLFRQLKQEFPNAESITGHRVSGAREKANSYNAASATPVVPLRMENLADTESLRRLFGDAFQSGELHPGIEGFFRPPEDWMPHEHQIAEAIQQEFKRIAPNSQSQIVDSIEEGREGSRTQAMYIPDKADPAKDMTVFTLMSPDALGDVHHEAIHQLRRGFFSHEEWETLRDAALENNWHEKYGIEKHYSDAHPDLQIEESVAEAFRNWMKEPKEVPEAIHPIFQKLREFFDRVKEKISGILGRDFSWDEIFQKVESGEIGSREQGREVAGSEHVRQPLAARGDIPEIGGKEAETLRDQIAKLTGELQVDKSHGKDVLSDPRIKDLKEMRERLRSITSGTFGMTVDQYSRYQKLMEKRRAEDLVAAMKSAEAQQRKTQTKEWKAARSDMRDQVREEIDSRPDVALDQMLSQEKLKFHPDFLTDQQKAMLPKEYIQKKNGINPDDAAGYFGYHSGDAMVERLGLMTADRKAAGMSAREWANHLIDTETDRRMEQTHGNLDQSILQEAQDQAISETQLNILHEEVLHLGLKAKSEFPISKAQLREWNKQIFDRTPIGSISTDEYLRTAGKAGRAAEMSLLKEDYADAFREKQRQNNAMIMANYAKQYEKERRSFDRTAKTFRKREVPSVPQEWTNWIHDILQRTGNRVNRSVQDLNEAIGGQKLQEFIDEKEAESMGNRPLPIADFLRDDDFRSTMDKLTADQFSGLKEAIDMLAKQGRDEKKIYAAGEAADRAQVVSEMRDRLKTFPQQLLPDERSWLQEKMQDPKKFFAGMTAIPTLMRRWERADPRGIFSRYITYPMRVADNTESVLQRETSRLLREVGEIKDPEKLVDSPFADPKTRTEENPNGTRWNGFSRKHVLGMLAHAGNKSNWRVLAKGYSADPEALMQWLVRNTTKEDWQQAQKRGDLVFKPLIDKADTVYENVSGAKVEKIPLESISNDHGDFAGWYHPLDADPLRKEVWQKDADTGQWQRNSTGKRDSVMDKYGKSYATTANGYTRKRSGAVYPLDLDITAMNGTINQMIHDISYRAPLLEVQKIIQNRAFQNEVDNHYGAHYKDLLEPWLQDMAGEKSIPNPTTKWIGEWSEYLRQNVISTYIGGNIYTALKHGPTALVMSSRTVGAKAFLPEFGKQLIERLAGDPLRAALETVGADRYAAAVKGMYARSPELGLTMSEYAMKHSEELQRRERHWQDTIRGETKVQMDDPTLREKVIEKGSWLVAQSDMLSAKPTWIAEFNKRIADGVDFGDARDLADDAVVRAHGSTGRSNQPALVRGGGPVHGWLTSVYGFMGARMQRMIEIGHQLNDIHQLGKERELKAAAARIPKLLTDAMSFAIWPILVEEAVQGIGTEDHRTWGTAAIHALTLGMSSSVLYIRDLVHGLTDNHEPGVGLLSSAAHDVTKPFRDVAKGKTAFDRQHAGKTVGDILTMLGEVKGISPKVIGNASRFGIDLVNKQQHPKTAGDYFRGLTRGTMTKRQEK